MSAYGYGYGYGRRHALGETYTPVNTEAATYFAAMTTQPNTARKAVIDASFTRMKARSYWAKLDWLSFNAAHDAQAARINLKNPAQVATLIGAPTFIVDQGYKGDVGVGLNTGVNPATAGGNFLQNSAHMGAWNWNENDTGAGAYQELSSGNAQLWSHYAPYFYSRTNTSVLTQVAPVNGAAIGHRAWSRTGSAAVGVYSDGVNILNDPVASSGLSSANVVTNSRRIISAMHFGGGLTDAEMSSLRGDIGAYFNDAMIIPAFDIFLIIGDSNNANGFGFNAAADLPSSDVWAKGYLFQTLIKAAPVDFYQADNASYSVAFFRDFYVPGGRLVSGRKILIVQTSGGGTSVVAGAAEWSAPSGGGYTGSLGQLKTALLAFPGSTLKGVLGVVGANDATASVNADTWATAFDNSVANLRANVPGAANVPVIIGGIPPKYLATGTAATINAKIVALPGRVAHTQYADPSSPTVLNHTSDPIHYDAQDQRGTLGVPGGMAGRFWTAWQALT